MKTLLIWDMGNTDIKCYLCEGKYAELAWAANGIYINSNSEEGDACEQINGLLGKRTSGIQEVELIRGLPAVDKISISGFLP